MDKNYTERKTIPFEEAFIAAKNGKQVARLAFRDTCYVEAQMPDEGSKNTEPYLVMVKGDKRFPVDLSCESLFGEDWYIL